MFAHTLQLCGDSIQTEHLFKQAGTYSNAVGRKVGRSDDASVTATRPTLMGTYALLVAPIGSNALAWMRTS